MMQKIRAFFKRISNFFSPPPDPNLVTIQSIFGNLEEVDVGVLFSPMQLLVEDGTPERAQLLQALAAGFSNNTNMCIGEVIQATPFDLENQGMTIEQITVLRKILLKEGFSLCTEICRPTWQELMDGVTAVKSDKRDFQKSLK